MLLLLPVWAALYWLCHSIGSLVFARLFRVFKAPADSFQRFWLGLAVTVAYLQLHSLVLPVDARAFVPLGALAAVGSPLGARLLWRRARRAFRELGRARFWLIAAGVALLVLLAAYSAESPIRWYDSRSTHIQQVKWLHLYGTPPGLANLNPKLAFDSFSHVFSALTDLSILPNGAGHIGLGLLTAVALAQWFSTVWFPGPRLPRLYCVVTSVLLYGKVLSDQVSSYSSDLPMTLVCLVLALELQRLPPRRRGFALFLIAALAGLAFAAKMSSSVLALLAGGFALWHLRGRRAAAAILPALLVAGMIARRVVLSGWPFFPIPIADFHLPWSVPLAATREQYLLVRYWARLHADYHVVLARPFSYWFSIWFVGFRRAPEFVLLLASVPLAAAALFSRARRLSAAARVALTGGALSIGYWFYAAPDLRFGDVFFWIVFAVLAARLAANVPARPLARAALASGWLLLAGWAVGFRLPLPAHAWLHLTPPPDDPPFATRVADNGQTPPLVLHIALDPFCEDAPLPCLDRLRETRWRVPGDLGRGFLPERVREDAPGETTCAGGETRTIGFDESTPPAVLASGWSPIVTSGGDRYAWMDGTARLRLVSCADGDRLLSLRAWPRPGGVRPLLSIYLNGRRLVPFPLEPGAAEYRVVAHRADWRPGSNELRLEVLRAGADADADGERDLSAAPVAFDWLQVTGAAAR